MALFERVCELDLEGIVAKQKFGPYVTDREHSTWFKILNRGWHSCAWVCAELERSNFDWNGN